MTVRPPASARIHLVRYQICLSIVCLLLAVATSCKHHPSPGAFPAKDEMLLADFVSGKPSATAAYDNLFLYFVQGFQKLSNLRWIYGQISRSTQSQWLDG